MALDGITLLDVKTFKNAGSESLSTLDMTEERTIDQTEIYSTYTSLLITLGFRTLTLKSPCMCPLFIEAGGLNDNACDSVRVCLIRISNLGDNK